MRIQPTIFSISLLLCLGNSVYSNVSNLPPPTNDLCSGAIDLGTLVCELYIEYDEDPEATPDAEATGNCIDNTGLGQWYTFTTPDPIPYNSIYVASPWIDMEIFSSTSDCSALVYESCGTGPFAFEPEAGTRYYLLTTGGLHLTLPFGGLSSCDEPLISFSSCEGPIHSSGYTDCAWSSDVVVCPNDHVIWFDYVAGNSGADVEISVGNFTGSHGNTADEVSISVFADDCSTLLYGFDAAGFGYVCSAMQAEQSITLEDLPPGFVVKIAIGSGLNDAGHFDLFIEAADEGIVSNDLCDDAEEIFEGITANLSNVCATEDFFINECPPQSEATVWYEYDPGTVPQDIEITLHSTGITSPAIAVYDECWGNLLGSVCGTSLELFCIDYPILIQIGSSIDDVGTFDLEIESNPSISALEPIVTGGPICSNSEAGISIVIPSGEIVNILVEISTSSSGSITGMQVQSFLGVTSAMIKDTLINTSNVAQEAIYTITIESFGDICPTDPVEFAILVHPEFKVTETSVEACAPFLLELDAFDIVGGGTVPFLGILWHWNSSNLIGTTNLLSVELVESGQITLQIMDYVGCQEEVKIDVDMTIPINPTFDFDLRYCRTDQDSISLPQTSLEGIEGIWSPPGFNLEVFTEDDFYDIVFTPNEEYCSNTVVDSIEIYSGAIPEFDLPELLCSEEDVYVFPVEDLNGITGSWDMPDLDLSTFEGVLINTFSHNNQGCSASFEYEFEVESNVELTFGNPTILCRNDDPYTLSDMSENGYVGIWDVAIVDPGLVVGNVFMSTWTPSPGQSPCLRDTTINIQISEPLIPEFNLPTELCSLNEVFTFPILDDQNLNGTWSIPDIDPGEEIGSIESVFTSSDYCVDLFTWEIEIVEPIIPDFNLELEHCELDEIYTLPLISENGISGTWSQSSIDPSISAGEQIEVEFQGDPTEFCVESLIVTFEVIEADDPIFDLPGILCWTDLDLVLPSSSMNTIEGIWNPTSIDVQSNVGGMVSSTFTPTDGSCSNEDVQVFEILAPFEVDAVVTDPSDCLVEDGSIQINIIEGDNLEYSIDDGATWQSTTLFSDLGSGAYTILIRSVELTSCQLSVESILNSPGGPMVNDVSSINISSCILENGSITVDADGNDLEYSIDNGMTWQTSNAFDNLPEGDYEITIRESMSDCTVEVSASISDFPETVILDVNTQNISDCNTNDGQIEILAEGESLEYSIDNGATWSTENIFDNLSDGQFTIIVQSTLGDDCTETTVVELESPDEPSIINIDALSPSECSPNTGRIDIDAEGINLEYSIDGGVTWFSTETFPDLESGLYLVMVRDSEKTNCFDEVSVELMLEDENLAESTFMITPPTECELADAVVEVINAFQDVEYSIDGGLIWQSSKLFENLPAGSYTIISRMVSLPECSVEQDVEIPNSECPCNDLMLDFIISNVSCLMAESARVDLVSVQGMYNPDVDILWSTGEMGNSIEGVEEGWQIVTIAYDDHCIWVDSVWVDLIDPIQFDWNIEDLGCPESDDGSIEIIDVTGGSGNYEYSIDGINYTSDDKFTDLPEGEYDLYVRDDGDCLSEAGVEVMSQDRVDIILNDVETIFIGENIVLDPGIDETEIDSFVWMPIEGISNLFDLIIHVSPKITTLYTLEIYYRGCFASKEVLVQVKLEEEIFVGNVFSPNGDNNNDYLFIQGKPNSTIEPLDFSVFDRWGNRIFNIEGPEFNNKTDGWDGHYQGQLAVSGVYVYMINYIQNGEEKMKVGTATLIY